MFLKGSAKTLKGAAVSMKEETLSMMASCNVHEAAMFMKNAVMSMSEQQYPTERKA